MNIVVVGCGKVGSTIVQQLSKENHNITVIDKNSDLIQTITNNYDVMGIIGNGASYSLQLEAGVDKADLMIAVTNSDELNLLCCLFAKKAGNCDTIARVRDPIYNQDINYIKEELGLSMAINPEYAAATEIARVLRMPNAIEISTFAKGRVEILKFKVEENSILNGMSLIDISIKLKCNVLICAVERGENVYIPTGQFIINSLDVVSFVASPKDANIFFNKINVVTNQVKDAMIIGGGKISHYLGKELTSLGIGVKIIEIKKDRCEELSELLPKATIINGDGTDHALITEEGLSRVGAFVTLTSLDEGNVMLSLFAKSRSKAKLVTKIRRKAFNEVIENLELGTIIYPEYITAEYIIRYVRARQNSIGSKVESLYKIISDKVEAIEFIIKEASPVVNVPLETLQLKDNLLIACINRKGKIIIPRGHDEIMIDDTVIVVTTHIGLDDIKNILKD